MVTKINGFILNMGTIIILLILVLIIYVVYTNIEAYKTGLPNLRINIAEAKARRWGFIIDARTPKEREILGYYPNSVPISFDRLQNEVPLDISSKNTWIMVYSNGDERALITAQKLYSMGYPNVRYIKETYLSLMPGSQ